MTIMGKCILVKGPMVDASVIYMFSTKSHLITNLWFLSDTKVFHTSVLREEVHGAYLTLIFDKAFESLQHIFFLQQFFFNESETKSASIMTIMVYYIIKS